MTTSYPNTGAYAKTQKLQQATELLKMTTEPPAGGADALNEQDLANILNQVSENQLQGLRLLQEDNNKYFSAQLDKFTEVITHAVPKPVVDKPSYGVPKPDAYGGQVTEDLNSWVEKFRSIAALNKWSEEDKARLLQLYLTGAALTFYHTLPGPTKNHFDTAVEALRAHFDDGPARNALHITLHNRKQLLNETVSQYTDDLERQFVRLDIRENYYKLLIFVEGLSAHLQYEVRKAVPGTYSQAKQLARNIEAAQNQQASNKSTAALSGISQHPNDTSSNTLSHQLTNLQHQFQQMQASLSRLESQRSNPPSPPSHVPSSFHPANQTSSRSNNRGNYQNFQVLFAGFLFQNEFKCFLIVHFILAQDYKFPIYIYVHRVTLPCFFLDFSLWGTVRPWFFEGGG